MNSKNSSFESRLTHGRTGEGAPVCERHASIRQAMTTASRPPSVGRALNTSKPVAARRSSIRTPPSHVARSSHRKRPRTESATGRPAANISRVRAAAPPRACRHAGVRWRLRKSSIAAPAARTSARGTYRRSFRKSTSRSCQKLVSCSAVQTASDHVVELIVAVTVHSKHQPPDRIRGAPAVVEQVRPRSRSAGRSRPA